MVERLDLNPFCIKGDGAEARPYLAKPWSRGEYTYATNGSILVRTPRRVDVAENSDAPDTTRLFAMIDWTKPLEVIRCQIPPDWTGECRFCMGWKTQHECPSCKCPCETCDGTGAVSKLMASIELAGALFDAKLVRLIVDLPKLRLFAPKDSASPIGYEFDAGAGAIMPVRTASAHHYVAVLSEAI